MKTFPMPMKRRRLLGAGLALLAAPRWGLASDAQAQQALALLRQGGVVLAYRHALAPGTFDPPGFRLGDCSSQRNLSEAGRRQARGLGQRLVTAGLAAPLRVRSSPWCRCMDTATLAFGAAQPWAALGSPRAGTERSNAESLAQLRAALREAAARPGGYEVWVTHMFVLADLVGANAASGEGLLLGVDGQGAPRLLGRLAPD